MRIGSVFVCGAFAAGLAHAQSYPAKVPMRTTIRVCCANGNATGLCRYTGMTISQTRSYEAIGKVLTREKPDFFRSITRLAIAKPRSGCYPPHAMPAPQC